MSRQWAHEHPVLVLMAATEYRLGTDCSILRMGLGASTGTSTLNVPCVI